jgi:hypothetical protein
MPQSKVWNRPGIGNVGSYQASGHPYITGSTVTSGSQFIASFPYVAKRVQVQTVDAAGGGHIRVHFAPSGSNNVILGNHWWHVEDGQPFDASVKCKELYISHDHGGAVEFRIFAELTHIPVGEMYELTGSGITD